MHFLLSWLGKEGQITTYGASLAQALSDNNAFPYGQAVSLLLTTRRSFYLVHEGSLGAGIFRKWHSLERSFQGS
jgi:hypothetical protein